MPRKVLAKQRAAILQADTPTIVVVDILGAAKDQTEDYYILKR